MNKKFFAVVIAAIIAITCFAGCTSSDQPNPTDIPLGEGTAKPVESDDSATATPSVTEEPTPTPTADPSKPKVISVDAYTVSDVNKGSATCKWIVDGEEYSDLNFHRWDSYMSNEDREHYVIIDLKSGYNLTSGEIYFEYCNLYYKIYVSATGQDDSWTEIYDSYADLPDMGASVIHEFGLTGSGRFVKIATYCPEEELENLLSIESHYYFSIWEFFIYGTADSEYKASGNEIDIAPTASPTPEPDVTATPEATATPKPIAGPASETNLSTGKTATCTTQENDSYAPGNAIDGNSSTRWSGYYIGVGNMSMTVDLGSVYEIYDNEIEFEYCASYYRIFVSETGEEGSFTPVYDSYLDEQSFGGSQTHEFTLSGVKARFVMIESYIPDENDEAYANCISGTGGHRYFGIYEWNIYGV